MNTIKWHEGIPREDLLGLIYYQWMNKKYLVFPFLKKYGIPEEEFMSLYRNFQASLASHLPFPVLPVPARQEDKDAEREAVENLLPTEETATLLCNFLHGKKEQAAAIFRRITLSFEYGLFFLKLYDLEYAVLDTILPQPSPAREFVYRGEINLLAASDPECRILLENKNLDAHLSLSIHKLPSGCYLFDFRSNADSFAGKVFTLTLRNSGEDVKIIKDQCREDLCKYTILCPYKIDKNTKINYTIENVCKR